MLVAHLLVSITVAALNFSRSTWAVLGLNVAWLAAASYYVARHYREKPESARVEYVTNYVPVAAVAAQQQMVTNTATATNEFRWAQLESEDYRTYIQRLRSIGCPEQTIRDIIIADVDKLLAPRLQAASLQPKDLKYWQPIEQAMWDDAAQRDAFLKQRNIDFEKREVIRELLGVDLVGERLKSQGQDDYHGARLQFLPEQKRARVRLVLDEYADQERVLLEQQVDEGAAFTGQTDLKKLQQEKSAALTQLLTPQEREQFDLWFSSTASRTRDAVYGMNASEEEFLKIYQLRREFDSTYADAAATPDAAQQLDARIHQSLGDERYAEYARAQDPDYRNLFATTSRFGLPQKLAAELFGFKQAAAEQHGRVESDANLSLAQKQAAQQAIIEETQQALKEALGDKAYRYYARRAQPR